MTQERRPPPRPQTSAPPDQAPEGAMTMERLARGINVILGDIEKLSGRVDRLMGTLAEVAESVHELKVALPEQERWCPPWLSDDGEVWCPGGYKLAPSKLGRAKGGKEWMHPMPKGEIGYSWNPETEQWVQATWHSVYESKAFKAPPAEGERPWPGRDGEDAEQGGSDAPDHPF